MDNKRSELLMQIELFRKSDIPVPYDVDDKTDEELERLVLLLRTRRDMERDKEHHKETMKQLMLCGAHFMEKLAEEKILPLDLTGYTKDYQKTLYPPKQPVPDLYLTEEQLREKQRAEYMGNLLDEVMDNPSEESRNRLLLDSIIGAMARHMQNKK